MNTSSISTWIYGPNICLHSYNKLHEQNIIIILNGVKLSLFTHSSDDFQINYFDHKISISWFLAGNILLSEKGVVKLGMSKHFIYFDHSFIVNCVLCLLGDLDLNI